MRALLLLFLSLLCSPFSHALSLGPAGRFDLFVFQNMEGYRSDVEGKMAVGGDLRLEDYAVGMELQGDADFNDSLIVGGSLDFTRGRVYHGNVVTGGGASLSQVGLYSDDPASPNGNVRRGAPLDFTAIAEDLRNLSDQWSSLTANGSVRTDGDASSWRLFLEGGDPWFNVFQLDSDLLSGTDTFYLDVPLQSTVLINVDGIVAEMSAFGFYRKVNGEWVRVPDNRPNDNPVLDFRHDGTLTRRVLFNFFNAQDLDIHTIGVKGSILAPWADLQFYNGHVDGNLIVNSLRTPAGQDTGQVNHYIFIPAPAAVWLLVAALPILAYWRMPNRYRGRSLLKTAGRGSNNHLSVKPPPNSS